MAKLSNGLMVLTLPSSQVISKISGYLNQATQLKKLYIKIEPDLNQSIKPETINYDEDILNVIPTIYRIACKVSPKLDLRVLLPDKLSTNNGLKYPPQVLLINETGLQETFWEKYLKNRFSRNDIKIQLLKDDYSKSTLMDENSKHFERYDHVCLGGTFDSLHNGHKVLLNEALIRCRKSLVIGVTDIAMIKNKLLWEMIQPIDVRIQNLKEFLIDVHETLEYNIVPINDPYGPSIEIPELECLVVSEETLKGGNKVNEKREERGLKKVDLVVVGLVNDDQKESENEEDKISSSSLRIRKLGTLLKQVGPKPNLPEKPYLIGLTGGIASGKSGIRKYLESLDPQRIGTIESDVVAHEAYQNPGSPAYGNILEAFGPSILDPIKKSIDRKRLAPIVFNNPDKLKLLNKIVWPETSKLIKQKIEKLKLDNKDVVILETPLLIEANIQDTVHQVWVTIIPEDEAVKRLQKRNNLTEEEAKQRISSQLPNHERTKHADIIFCSKWDIDFTRSQVRKAWEQLKNMLDIQESSNHK